MTRHRFLTCYIYYDYVFLYKTRHKSWFRNLFCCVLDSYMISQRHLYLRTRYIQSKSGPFLIFHSKKTQNVYKNCIKNYAQMIWKVYFSRRVYVTNWNECFIFQSSCGVLVYTHTETLYNSIQQLYTPFNKDKWMKLCFGVCLCVRRSFMSQTMRSWYECEWMVINVRRCMNERDNNTLYRFYRSKRIYTQLCTLFHYKSSLPSYTQTLQWTVFHIIINK